MAWNAGAYLLAMMGDEDDYEDDYDDDYPNDMRDQFLLGGANDPYSGRGGGGRRGQARRPDDDLYEQIRNGRYIGPGAALADASLYRGYNEDLAMDNPDLYDDIDDFGDEVDFELFGGRRGGMDCGRRGGLHTGMGRSLAMEDDLLAGMDRGYGPYPDAEKMDIEDDCFDTGFGPFPDIPMGEIVDDLGMQGGVRRSIEDVDAAFDPMAPFYRGPRHRTDYNRSPTPSRTSGYPLGRSANRYAGYPHEPRIQGHRMGNPQANMLLGAATRPGLSRGTPMPEPVPELMPDLGPDMIEDDAGELWTAQRPRGHYRNIRPRLI